MPKQVFKITDFSGGVNAYADPRDIEDNEFAQNWNAALDKYGVISYTGGGKSEIIGLPHGNANFEPGYGVFSIGVEYTISIIDGEFENGFEQSTLQTNFTAADATEILNNTGNLWIKLELFYPLF